MNIPKGFKLVPVKPTDDMVIAFSETWYSKRQAYDDPDMDDAYRDMLAAAPTPPQPIYDETWDRVLFERLVSERGFSTEKVNGFYFEQPLNFAWSICLELAQSRAKAGEDE
ncbi:hypothetical protein [Pseudomonas sp. LG1D9]|uniref:hypothetical protein n=1 Tax=Pseudomonas sp. LG1D9 TaxID=2083054 RepID=UPI000CF33157|nr:hypothetical protein [Pseudomonas sp. LG1D9]